MAAGVPVHRFDRELSAHTLIHNSEGYKIADKLLTGGGIIPDRDISRLLEAGIARIFGPGTSLGEISDFIQTAMEGKNSDNKG